VRIPFGSILRPLPHSISFSIAASLLLLATSAQATSGQRIEELVRETVTKLVAEKHAGTVFTVTPQPLAASARLKPCDQLQAQVRSKTLSGRVPVHIRCTSPVPWAMYASAQVSVEVPVLVAVRGISRGERIEANLLETEHIPLHRLRPQTVTKLSDAVGKVARRAISAQQPITLHHLSTPPVVAKGDRVHILANSGRVQIQTFGIAMANGQVGEQIQVRNETSDRVIRPWIVSRGKVATTPPNYLPN
jgi:flagella basal body P-ring formation protein FlgA